MRRVTAVGALLVIGIAVSAVLVSLDREGIADEEPAKSEGRDAVAPREFDFEAAVERARAEERARMGPRVAVTAVTADANETQMVEAVIHYVPRFRARQTKARRLVSIIYDAAMTHRIDPWIALAVAYRESSLLPSVGSGGRRGARGELGYFQIMPGGSAMRVCGAGRPMTSPAANADTAMCYLAHVRQLCESDDPSIYVAAYSMRNCPTTPAKALRIPATRRARELLCEMAGDERCERIWPRST